ncbi:hypothetical protein [Phocoenobacter skyensis]|uniref:hypothetical protein n=1 Tax=Phocoenobacter skyensis TaxID=97481 RepID=UPI002754F0C3|nr:hypothetical protein [Pasteurella skyensis]MDP8186125.1 hypothetical protein [Pasteurella skyensis]
MTNLRFFIEKQSGFDIEAKQLCAKFKQELHIQGLESLKVINGYDIFDLEASVQEIAKIKYRILSELVSDKVIDELKLTNKTYFAVECLDGQFDQRADSALQCIEIIGIVDKIVGKKWVKALYYCALAHFFENE